MATPTAQDPKRAKSPTSQPSFKSLGLIEPLLRVLAALEQQTPTEVQTEAIPAVLAGRDLLAAAQTGTGKTAAFALPLLQRLVTLGPVVTANGVRALVLVPTRELAEQVHQSVRGYGQHLPLRTYAAYGGVSINPQMMAMRRGVDVLVATPGRLLDLHRQNAVKLGQVQALVLDEADRMLDLGFSEELTAILALLPKRRQTLLLSATISDEIAQLAARILERPLRVQASPVGLAATSVAHWLIPVDKHRKAELFGRLLGERNWSQVLVFVKTRRGVDSLCEWLAGRGVAVEGIHGDRPQASRQRALERFKAKELRVLLATDVAARGLDIDDLPVVVNFDLPIVAEDYVHRIGRTGRAGNSGQAISLVSADEVPLLAAIERLVGQTLLRREESGFSPQHRLPLTEGAAVKAKKPKRPKRPKASPAAGRPGGQAPAR